MEYVTRGWKRKRREEGRTELKGGRKEKKG